MIESRCSWPTLNISGVDTVWILAARCRLCDIHTVEQYVTVQYYTLYTPEREMLAWTDWRECGKRDDGTVIYQLCHICQVCRDDGQGEASMTPALPTSQAADHTTTMQHILYALCVRAMHFDRTPATRAKASKDPLNRRWCSALVLRALARRMRIGAEHLTA